MVDRVYKQIYKLINVVKTRETTHLGMVYTHRVLWFTYKKLLFSIVMLVVISSQEQ